MSFNIIGTGRGIPRLVVDNDRISRLVDTSDEWISSRSGISERHILTDETMLDICTEAAKNALCAASFEPSKLDYIICSTVAGDYITPSMACLIQAEIGASCPAFDINAACTGFVYALDIASGLFDSGRAENILIVSAEAMSRHVDWTDRRTCVLFGDGAGSVLLTKGDGLLAVTLNAQGGKELLNIPGIYCSNPFCDMESSQKFIFMNGQEVFKFAVSSMCRDIETVLAKANLTPDGIAMILPHQANARIIDAAKKRLNIPDTKIAYNIARYGNTSSAGIPILLSELIDEKKLKKGDIIVLSAFGGGLTSGAAVIRV